MDTLVENVVLLVTNSTAILSYIYPTIYEKINMCWPLNLSKDFLWSKEFSGQNDKNSFESP